VRDEKLTTLEDVIRRLTSHPASVLGLRERGSLREGYFADVVVFDPAKIQDHATYAEPHQYSTGVSQVIVNGQLALENGEPTAARPGRFVRGRAWTGWKDGGCRAAASDWDWPKVD
jgi:N-acyl-D-amino-acid deacylase